MHCSILGAVLLALLSPAASATELRRISVNGEQRSYRLFIPPNPATAPLPIVIGLHGAVQSAAEFETDFGMNRIARREGFAVVYPEGINRVWDDARPPMMRLGYVVRPGDDVAFITALVRQLIREGIADPSRIYLAGLSMGGFMAARLACERSELFAALAMMAATVPEEYRTTCRPRRTLPGLMMHGTFDTIIPGSACRWPAPGFCPRPIRRNSSPISPAAWRNPTAGAPVSTVRSRYRYAAGRSAAIMHR
jgi:polyhydroxybutyrate depolymerase